MWFESPVRRCAAKIWSDTGAVNRLQMNLLRHFTGYFPEQPDPVRPPTTAGQSGHPGGELDPQADPVGMNAARQCRLLAKPLGFGIPARLFDSCPPGWDHVKPAEPAVIIVVMKHDIIGGFYSSVRVFDPDFRPAGRSISHTDLVQSIHMTGFHIQLAVGR